MKAKKLIRWAALASWLIILLVAVVQAGQLNYSGKPDFDPGDDQGYYIWKDGKEWKVRWTTYGGSHNFSGTIEVFGATVQDLDRVKLDEKTKVVGTTRQTRVVRDARGRRHVVSGRKPVVASRPEDRVWREDARTIKWTSANDGDVDGFDFKAQDAEKIRFVLRMDGQTRRSDVTLGRSNDKPSSNPFTIDL